MKDVNCATPRGRMSRGRLATILIAISSLGLLATAQPVQAAGNRLSYNYNGGSNNCGGTTIYKADGTPWTCSFDDEFSGYRVDTNKWYVGTTAATGYYVGDSCIMANAVSESNGELRITSRDTGTPFTCKTPTGSFTTRDVGGSIATTGHFAQAYGRFEVRARFPQTGAGANAFWLYPPVLKYGGWPASGEIDVAEWWASAPNQSLSSLHYSGSTAADSGWCASTDPTAWHTYTLVWLPTQMTFSVDGQTCFTDTWSPNSPLVAPQPFDQPFNMVLTAAVNNDSSVNAATTITTTPATYEVDYARAWK